MNLVQCLILASALLVVWKMSIGLYTGKIGFYKY